MLIVFQRRRNVAHRDFLKTQGAEKQAQPFGRYMTCYCHSSSFFAVCTCRTIVPSTSFRHANYRVHQQLCLFLFFSSHTWQSRQEPSASCCWFCVPHLNVCLSWHRAQLLEVSQCLLKKENDSFQQSLSLFFLFTHGSSLGIR